MGVWAVWSYDITTLMATYLSPLAAAAMTIIRNIGMLSFMIPLGFSNATAIMIGKSVGQGNSGLALQYYRTAMKVTCLFTTFQLLLLFLCRD